MTDSVLFRVVTAMPRLERLWHNPMTSLQSLVARLATEFGAQRR
jgi:hypothetical protein